MVDCEQLAIYPVDNWESIGDFWILGKEKERKAWMVLYWGTWVCLIGVLALWVCWSSTVLRLCPYCLPLLASFYWPTYNLAIQSPLPYAFLA